MNGKRESLKSVLLRNPVIPAVKNDAGLKQFLNSSNEIVFVLYGDILNLNDIVDAVIEKNKIPFIHLDMVHGLAPNAIVMDYFYKHFGRGCGIITTKASMAKKAMEHDMRVIQRYFMLDSLSVESALEGISKNQTDAIEIMPGIIPRVIHQISLKKSVPIIAGGLIQTDLDVEKILASGAISISTSKSNLWKFKDSRAKIAEKI